MKVNGIDEQDHKIFSEIERNRGFIKKIKDAETTLDDSLANQAVDGEPQKKLKLDTAAAMRMAKPYLNSGAPGQDRSYSHGKPYLGKQKPTTDETQASPRPTV